ncbi:MAG TPA: Rrf2 family transcriptional regulator [Chloroflexota bacterium]
MGAPRLLPPGVAGDGPVPVARLAEFHGVPAAYLQKHLQALVRAGILESVAGRRELGFVPRYASWREGFFARGAPTAQVTGG